MRRMNPTRLVAVILVMSAWGAMAEAPVAIGSQRELFVDEYLIAELKDVRLELHEPTLVPRADSPLPERHMVTVIKDGDRFRAWYRGMDPGYTGEMHTGHPGESVFYAESTDGHEWTFPVQGLHEIGGTMENNAILAKMPPYLTNFMPFLDTRPGVDPAERYKATAGYPGPGDKRGVSKAGMGLFGFVSPDGITWTKQEEIIPYRPEWRHAFDSPNVTFWSEAEQKYVCYFRTWIDPARLRSVSRVTSEDFVTWSDPVPMDPNFDGEHLYSNMTQPYVRAPHIYIALPTRFVPQESDSAETVMPNITDLMFMTSRAGSERYDRTFAEAFIRPGLDPKRWENRANFVANNVVLTAPDELSIYHRSGDRYVLRADGFASVHAGAKEGSMLTKLLTFSGDQLELNFSTSAMGSVQVEILNEGGNVIAVSEKLVGDAIDRVVTWQDEAKLAEIAGKPVRLRFTLKDADLYSLRFFAQ